MKHIFLITFILHAFILQGQINPQWIRYASISPDANTIVFTYKGDLYTVPSDGGDAKQITFHKAHDYQAVWSKDGEHIAFASDRYGNFDVFVMNAQGGLAKRLTFHSNDEHPFTFSHDDSHIIFGAQRQDKAEHRQYPTGSQPELYTVPVTGGRVDQMFTIPAEHVQVSKDGNSMIYHDKKGGENEWRKHHTSSITRDLWVYDKNSNTHSMISSFEGEDRQPVWSDDEQHVYYLSEESGTFNVHRMSYNNPEETEQITYFDLHPVRFLSQAKGKLCFTYDGQLYTMEGEGEPVKLEIAIVTQEKDNSDKFISINGGVGEMSISPDGKEIAFISRGEVFVTSVDEAYTKRLTTTPEQERFVTWTPDGKGVVYSSERNGKWSVYKTVREREEEPYFFASTIIKEEPLIENDLDNYLAKFSPDGKKIAFIEGRKTLKVKDIESGEDTILLTPKDLYHMRDGDKEFAWSPDSKWLLVEWGKLLNNSDVLLLAADGSGRVNLNESGFYDYSPKWVNKGKQMLWFSNRNGLKSLATSGRFQSDVYSMFFTQDAWDKFNLSEADFKLMKEIEDKKKEEEEDKKEKDKDEKKDKEEIEKVEDLTFDWEGMEERTARLTIHSSYLGDAVLSKDGEKLYYLARFEDKLNLWSTNLRTKETKMALKLNANSGSLEWDKKMENLYLLSSGSISKIDPDAGKNEGVKIKGEMYFDADAERAYMFDHVWIRTNAIFYHSNFHGIDWDLMGEEYRKYLPHISNSYEFTEMISEMLGELNVSHAGGRYSDNITNGDATASLGIFMDYNHSGEGILIREVIQGGPLDKATFEVEEGMIIEKINGEIIQLDRDIASYLNRIAGEFTLLEILNPDTQERITITVKPITLREERSLLYKRWVKANEKEVIEKSNGKLGYVHIPGMSDGPYRNVFDLMLGKYFDTDGIIVDARFNGGGDLVADLAMFFTGEKFITYETEDKVVGGEPTSRWTKPTLAMFNESMYSDGHCFACGYSDLKIGKTVGMPVPGTCSFAGWERLPAGIVWGVVPVSAKDKSGDWMENNQTEPDILVKNMPGIIDNGRDQQLERAIQEMMTDLGIN